VQAVTALEEKLKYRLYRLKWDYYQKFGIVSSFPFHVDIETTDACNLRCIMCVHGTTGVKNTGMIDTDFAKALIDQMASQGAYSVKFNWRGEPALHKGLVFLVKYASQKGLIDVQFNTNGLPYSEGKIEELIEAGLDRIIFSMDGATKETYESIRVGADYDKLIYNVKTFHQLRKKMNRTKPHIRIQMIKMKTNKDEVKQFIEMWKPFVDEIQINEVTDRGQGDTLNVGDRVAVGRRRCPQPWQRMVVSWDGKVMPCCGDWNMKWIIGDAKKESLKAIWKGEKMSRLRRLIKDLKLNQFEPCKNCFAQASYIWKDASDGKSC
jgi:radical SAM protein with 4Fe4S-binding SPASM domain